MKTRWLLLLMIVVLLPVLGYFWFTTGPKRAARRWLECEADAKTLVTRSDREYWDEAKAQDGENQLAIYEEACLGQSSVEESGISGRSAIVKIKYQVPDLSWDEMTEFPATATRAEKIKMIRERAERRRLETLHLISILLLKT